MKRKKTAAVDTAAGRLSVSYRPAADLLEWTDPYRKQIADTVGPLAKQARKSSARAAHDALERVTPVLDDAWERVTPAVEHARDKVQDDLIPRLNHALAEAAEHPVAQEAARRGRATAAALRGEVEVAPKKKRGRKVLGVLAVLAAVGGAVYAVKKYLDTRDAEWEAPAPSTYGGSNTAKRADTSPWAATTDKVTSTPAPSAATTPATPTAPEPTKAAEAPKAEAPKAEKPGKADDSAASDSDASERNYGPGSYVGTKPPKGFEIKGNERSMKFHTPDSPAYDRTISDVWFNSVEVAEKNGFTRAQR